jgi:D-alanine-D-alanine ligase
LKLAIVYNRDSHNVINLFGTPNREKIGKKTIKRIADALKANGHQVKAIEGDKDLIERLEEFMPRVVKGELPGLVFNVSYGIQGQARYTHVPGILEMVGVPYVGSGPLAHGLALDKVVAKILFRQYALPTPDFAVVDSWEGELPNLAYPLIVKPKNEAVSFGLRIVNNDDELREGVRDIIDKFEQQVLVEHYIEGREINIGLIGNNPPETLPPVELIFGPNGPPVYTYDDKMGTSERQIDHICPAPLSAELTIRAQKLARRAFEVLGCYDCARVDMRLDKKGNLYLLELNSLPSLGEHGSYLIGAAQAGLDFKSVINRLVEVASARYFGTPRPQILNTDGKDKGKQLSLFLAERRDHIERRIETWTNLNSRTSDPVGVKESVKRMSESLKNIGLKPIEEYTDKPFVKAWQTRAGFVDGTLLIGHLDTPLALDVSRQSFRRTPEWLYGEAVGSSRAPIAMMEYVLRGLKTIHCLQKLRLGVIYYTDEGRECEYSAQIIRKAAEKAKKVLVLTQGNPGNRIITQCRGYRKYLLTAEAPPRKLGKTYKSKAPLHWVCSKIDEISKLSSKKERIAIAASDIQATSFPMLLPHRIVVTLLVSYVEQELAEDIEKEIRDILGKDTVKWQLEMISQRPPMRQRKANRKLAQDLAKVAQQWEIPFAQESSLWPTIAGVVPESTAVVCGLGPIAKDLHTPHEAVERISILQRTLLLGEFLLQDL